MKLGNPHRDAETRAMKETGITSRVKFRRAKLKAQKELKEFESNVTKLKTYLNELVSHLLEINNIEHDHYEEHVNSGVLILDHYIVAPQETVNIIQSSYGVLIEHKGLEIDGAFVVRFNPANVN